MVADYLFPRALRIKLRRLPLLHKALKWVHNILGRAFAEAVLEFSRWIWRENENFGPPEKTFSIYQALRTGDPKINGRILIHDQGGPIVREDSIMVRGGYQQHKEQPWPIFWSEHDNARLVTESLAMLLPGKQICLESIYRYHTPREDPAFRFFRLPRALKLSGNWTSIVSRWVPTESKRWGLSMPNYTHWILDALPRLGLVSEFPKDTQIIVPADLHRNQKDSLMLLGLWDRCRLTTERHLQIERYFFTSPTTMLQGFNPYGIDFLRRSFLPKRDLAFSGPRRFFIRRLGLPREPLNLAEIEKFFEKRGWEPIDIVGLTFAQQVQLFHEAESIVGMFGSGFTNCVFCRPGCQAISIMPAEFGLDGYLDWIAQVVRFDWHPIVISCGYDYRFRVDLDCVAKHFDAKKVET
jgi:hypothetical protein